MRSFTKVQLPNLEKKVGNRREEKMEDRRRRKIEDIREEKMEDIREEKTEMRGKAEERIEKDGGQKRQSKENEGKK